MVLLQKGANVNVDVNPMPRPDLVVEDEEDEYVHALQQRSSDGHKEKKMSLFQGLIQNSWLGITYLALEQLEKFGMSYAMAVEVAFLMQKVQFGKNLIAKQVSAAKLSRKVTNSRNLIAAFAFEVKAGSSADIQPDVVEALTAVGINPMEPDDDGCTALHYACMNANLTLVKALLDSEASTDKAWINGKDKAGMTPLGAALWNGLSGSAKCVIELLMKRGADPNILVPLKELSHFEASYKNAVTSPKVINRGVTRLTTPLIMAVVYKDDDLIFRLLKGEENVLHADLNLADADGLTPLMHAVKTNSTRMVVQLMRGGLRWESTAKPSVSSAIPDLDLNAEDKDGLTALHHSFCVDRSSKSPRSYDNVEMLNILLAAGVKVTDGPNLHGRRVSALEMAAELSNESIVTRLAKSERKPVPSHLAKDKYVPWDAVDDGVVWDGPFEYDVKADAKSMLKKLEIQAEKERKKEAEKGGSSQATLRRGQSFR